MKIGSQKPQPVPAAPTERRTTAATATQAAATATPTAAATAEPSAKVALSSAATGASASGADPSFDTAKVDRIAQAIRDGKYKVNPEAIADKLIANAAELLGRKAS